MGMLMWHETEELKDIVILKPIDFFIKPATVIICKHTPSDNEHNVVHFTETHERIKEKHNDDWKRMINHGIVTEEILNAALLVDYGVRTKYIIKLMVKYSLLVPLNANNTHVDNSEDSITGGEYLAPALLPEKVLNNNISDNNKWIANSNVFYFVFALSSSLKKFSDSSYLQDYYLTNSSFHTHGFLPDGLFEKLIGKIAKHSEKSSEYSNVRVDIHNLYKNEVKLFYGNGNQTFSIKLNKYFNYIEVCYEKYYPIAIYEKLNEEINKVISECMNSLHCFCVLPYTHNTNIFIKLESLRKVENSHEDLNLIANEPQIKFGSISITTEEFLTDYGIWRNEYKSLGKYDIFISYRWTDSHFEENLWTSFKYISFKDTDENSISFFRRIDVFLDKKSLPQGKDFQSEFVQALMSSSIITPIVSYEALVRIRAYDDNRVDNLLIEWICALECNYIWRRHADVRQNIRVQKIWPILFGKKAKQKAKQEDDDDNCQFMECITSMLFGEKVEQNNDNNSEAEEERISNLFSDPVNENIVNSFPHIVPSLCLQKAHKLLRGKLDALNIRDIAFSYSPSSTTVNVIMKDLLVFNGLKAWEYQPNVLDKVASLLTKELHQCLS